MNQKATERYGRIEDLDRSFDQQYWQGRSDTEKFAAAWDLVVTAWKIKGKDESELRLQRTVEAYGKISENEA